jgi:hypothetical protein
MLKILTPWQALLIKISGEKTLVVSDFHIGFEYELADLKISIPSQVSKLRSKLLKIAQKIKPDKLVLLGDVKHSVPKVPFQEWKDLTEFLEVLSKHVSSVEIIPGNHDGDIQMFTPPEIKVLPPQGIVLGRRRKVALLHGHTWPPPEAFNADYLVLGHNHPAIHLIDKSGFRIVKQVWVRFACNMNELTKSYLKHLGVRTKDPIKTMENRLKVKPKSLTVILMPSFNEALGGLPVNLRGARLLGPLFRSGGVLVNSGEVFLLDGTCLGTVNQLRLLQK